MKSRLLFVAVLVLSLPLCFAQTSPVNFTFSSDETPLYDFTGEFQVEDVLQGGAGDVPLAFGITITDDGRGRLRGSDVLGADLTFLTIGNDTVAANYVVTGRVGGGVNATRVTLTVRLFGEDTIGGVSTKFNLVIRYDLQVMGGVLQGKSRGSAKFAKLGSARILNPAVSLALPAGMDGSWSLQMNIVPLSKLAGSGSIVLSNGRVLASSLSGRFSSGRFTVKLTGIDDNGGGRLNLVFFEGAGSPEIFIGRILGQTIRK